MGLFFEVRFDFVALGRSREIGSGLQFKALGFLVDPNDNGKGFAPLTGRPLSWPPSSHQDVFKL